MSMFSLNGKIALVTGASYGIGFAIASALHEAGATIVFNDIKQEFVDKGLAAYREKGIDAHGYVCDVTDETAVNAMIQQIEKEVCILSQQFFERCAGLCRGTEKFRSLATYILEKYCLHTQEKQ